jgi:hypothetical protein
VASTPPVVVHFALLNLLSMLLRRSLLNRIMAPILPSFIFLEPERSSLN